VDTKRVYATGHSNGGAFTYLLWQTRGEKFAAFAPSSAASAAVFDKVTTQKQTGATTNSKFLSKPLFHIGGDNDPLVKPEWQKLTIDGARKINQCGEATPWPQDARGTLYPSKVNAPVVTYIHHSKHQFPGVAREMVVKFFKEQTQ
jgi:polyhydroxybutyrate depolymerase